MSQIYLVSNLKLLTLDLLTMINILSDSDKPESKYIKDHLIKAFKLKVDDSGNIFTKDGELLEPEPVHEDRLVYSSTELD